MIGDAPAGRGWTSRFPELRDLRWGRRPGKRIPVVHQTSRADCGAACLAMVLAYHGRSVALDPLRRECGIGRDGAAAQALLDAAERHRLSGRGLQIEGVDDLRLLPPGAILHWRFRHWVVLERVVRGGGAWIVDPSGGRRRVSREALGNSFTGVALVFDPGPGFEKRRAAGSGVLRYLRQILLQRDVLWRVFTASLVVQLLGLTGPLLTSVLIDEVLPRADRDLFVLLALGAAGVGLFQTVTGFVKSHLLLTLRVRLDAKFSLDFLDHLVDLPLSFFQSRSSGDLMMRLGSNRVLRETLTATVLSGLLDVIMVSSYLLVLVAGHSRLALLVLILSALRVLLFLLSQRKFRELMSESLEVQARSQSYQVELLAGIETLKAMGAERRGLRAWANLFVEGLNVSIRQGRLSAAYEALLGAVSSASSLGILLYGAHLVLAGELTLGTMMALTAVAAGFLGPLSSLVGMALQLQTLKSYLERIADVMDTPREQEREGLQRLAPSGDVELRELSFRYSEGAAEVVRNVSLRIAAGQFVALVGRSGAGKTTLARLLLGLHLPTQGEVLFDGVDIRSLDLSHLRRSVGIVTQEPRIFGRSLRDNIALADSSLPLDRIVEASRSAQLHRDVQRMPMGYETILSESGSSLSGGQRQRLALARALVTRPRILLLDEATSHLDSATEARVLEALTRLECTRIVVAHRLSTVRSADLIVVMEDGEVVETGTHDELRGRPGRYRELWAAQADVDLRESAGRTLT